MTYYGAGYEPWCHHSRRDLPQSYHATQRYYHRPSWSPYRREYGIIICQSAYTISDNKTSAVVSGVPLGLVSPGAATEVVTHVYFS